MPKSKILICPYCGATQPEAPRCRECAGVFEPLSRQATHNAMGPWAIRDPRRPFQPPCSYETLVSLIERGQVTKNTILRGPTTRQFWTAAKRVPGIAHLFGYCHQCDEIVEPTDHGCPRCGAVFGAYLDRDHLGLPEIRPMPWEADIEGAAAARAAFGSQGIPVPGRHLSSFASDEEMLGRAASGVAVAPHRAGNGERASDGGKAGSAHAHHRPAAASDIAGTATRAMQRRLAGQERHIRMMSIALGLALVLVVVLTVVQLRMIAGRGGDDSSGAVSTELPQPPRRTEAPAPAPPHRPEQQKPVQPTETAPAGQDAPLEAEPGAAPDGQWDAKHQEALALAGTGADKSLERATRLEAYRKALEILADIATHAPAASRPTDLEELTQRLVRELEQLELEEFFP